MKTNSSPSSWETGGFLPFFISVLDTLLEGNIVEYVRGWHPEPNVTIAQSRKEITF